MSVNFTKIVAIILVAATVGGVIGYLIVKATIAFGMWTVLVGLALLWLLMIVGCMAGAMSETQLIKMEEEEAEVMRKLRTNRE
jgi:hypothetical protein